MTKLAEGSTAPAVDVGSAIGPKSQAVVLSSRDFGDFDLEFDSVKVPKVKMGLSHLASLMIMQLFPLTYGLGLLGKTTQYTHLRLIKRQHGDIVPILVLYGPKLLSIERVR